MTFVINTTGENIVVYLRFNSVSVYQINYDSCLLQDANPNKEMMPFSLPRCHYSMYYVTSVRLETGGSGSHVVSIDYHL